MYEIVETPSGQKYETINLFEGTGFERMQRKVYLQNMINDLIRKNEFMTATNNSLKERLRRAEGEINRLRNKLENLDLLEDR